MKLKPKAMAVLVYLADRPGQVVSRDALLSAVWSGVVVGDDSLTQVVIKLRKALGDAPEKPAYIQTIPKGGYRLIATVVRSAEISSVQVRPDAEPLYSERKRRVPWIAGTAIAALLLAAAGAWLIGGERLTGVPPRQASMASAEPRTAQPTISIKPFEAFGNDPQAVLLAQGITADLVTDLSKVSGLSVIGVAPWPPSERTPTTPHRSAISYLDPSSASTTPAAACQSPTRKRENVVVERFDARATGISRSRKSRAEDSPDAACEGKRGRMRRWRSAIPAIWKLRYSARAVALLVRKERRTRRSRNVPARHRAGRGLCSCVCSARTDLRRGLP